MSPARLCSSKHPSSHSNSTAAYSAHRCTCRILPILHAVPRALLCHRCPLPDRRPKVGVWIVQGIALGATRSEAVPADPAQVSGEAWAGEPVRKATETDWTLRVGAERTCLDKRCGELKMWMSLASGGSRLSCRRLIPRVGLSQLGLCYSRMNLSSRQRPSQQMGLRYYKYRLQTGRLNRSRSDPYRFPVLTTILHVSAVELRTEHMFFGPA